MGEVLVLLEGVGAEVVVEVEGFGSEATGSRVDSYMAT